MQIIAHRGASAEAPENTLAAMRLAWEQGADGLEIDVRPTREGLLVAVHDADTLRYGGRSTPVAQEAWAELRTLDVGRWKDPRFAGERIPSLDEMLAALPDGRRILVELKCGPETADGFAASVRRSARDPRAVTAISFHLDTLAAVKSRLPECSAWPVIEMQVGSASGGWSPDPAEIVRRSREAGFDGVDLSSRPPLDRALLDTLHGAGLVVGAWTVNDPHEARRLQDLGLDLLTTDRPGAIRAALAAG